MNRPEDEPADTGSEIARAPVEGDDYYLDDGLMVFTAAFLQGRGYCCESGCRHCPYGFIPERVK